VTTDHIPQPGDLLGYVNGQPVWLFAGGDEPQVEPDDTDDADDATDDWTPPTRDEWDRLQAAKKRASDESAARRKYLQQHGIDHRTGEKAGGDEPPPPAPAEPAPAPAVDRVALQREIQAAVQKAVAKTELKYKPALEKNAVKAALDDSGCDPAYRDLIRNSLDLTDVEYDDEGRAVGLDDQIAALKIQYPQVFSKKSAPTPRRTGGAAEVDGGQRQPPPAAKKSWMDQINDQMSA
jgi:hypothetical protein